MLIKDVRVGEVYAYRATKHSRVDRVEVVSTNAIYRASLRTTGNGLRGVKVRFLDEGWVQAGTEKVVLAKGIVCTWVEWGEREAQAKAERETRTNNIAESVVRHNKLVVRLADAGVFDAAYAPQYRKGNLMATGGRYQSGITLEHAEVEALLDRLALAEADVRESY